MGERGEMKYAFGTLAVQGYVAPVGADFGYDGAGAACGNGRAASVSDSLADVYWVLLQCLLGERCEG